MAVIERYKLEPVNCEYQFTAEMAAEMMAEDKAIDEAEGASLELSMNFQQLFALGMKRNLPPLLTCEGPACDIGAWGKFVAPGAIPLGPPTWRFPRDSIHADDDSVATLHGYHFLEHLSGDDAILFMREADRVLTPERGVFNFSILYFSTVLMAQNLQHKSFWCEKTFRNLFQDDTYEHSGRWRLKVHFLIIAGIINRNLALLGQLY